VVRARGEILKKAQVTLITYQDTSHGENIGNLVKLFETHFDNAGVKLEVNVCKYQPDQNLFGSISREKFLIDSAISYYLFSASYVTRKKVFFSRLYSSREWLKLLFGFNSKLGERETPAYMRRDQFLTDKHLRAIFNFLETDNEFLLIASDDVVKKQDSPQRLLEETITILDKFNDYPIYIELAEYYELNVLVKQFGLHEYELDPTLGNWRRVDFFCNTGACYAINRRFARHIATTVTKMPWLRVCSIDWLLTYIGRLPNEYGPIMYFSRKEPVLQNYSLESGHSDLVG
jgi:hypothetical protein